jgi:hypothetical protein
MHPAQLLLFTIPCSLGNGSQGDSQQAEGPSNLSCPLRAPRTTQSPFLLANGLPFRRHFGAHFRPRLSRRHCNRHGMRQKPAHLNPLPSVAVGPMAAVLQTLAGFAYGRFRLEARLLHPLRQCNRRPAAHKVQATEAAAALQ